MDFKKYKNALGTPGKGLHAHGPFGVAIFDVILTMTIGMIASHFAIKSGHYTLALLVTPSLFLLGIGLHRLFGVRTTVDKMLFPDQ
jgi:hypothetical protein